jgi:hypothetical protein
VTYGKRNSKIKSSSQKTTLRPDKSPLFNQLPIKNAIVRELCKNFISGMQIQHLKPAILGPK